MNLKTGNSMAYNVVEFVVSRVRVTIADVNDNTPVVDSVHEPDSVVVVPCDAVSGHVITRVVAHDRDMGDNAKLVYFVDILKSSDGAADKFNVDRETGEALLLIRSVTLALSK